MASCNHSSNKLTKPGMKNSFKLKCVAAGMLLSTGMSAFAMEPDVLYAKLAPSVVDVIATSKKSDTGKFGSGVVIDDERVITNCHVLTKTDFVTVKWGEAILFAKLLYPDTERDLCELKVPSLKAPKVTIAPKSSLRIGQRVYAIGNPHKLERTFSEGLISSLRNIDGMDMIQTTAEITHGSSGGGLFDVKGRLIGITRSGLGEANINFAVPAYYISELPQRGKAEIKKLLGPKKPQDKPAENNTPAVAQASTQPAARILNGSEILRYFGPDKRLAANQDQPHPFEITIGESGFVRRYCPLCHLQDDDGRLKIDVAMAQVCFDWSRATYPDSGCFNVEKLSETKFRMHLIGRKGDDIDFSPEE